MRVLITGGLGFLGHHVCEHIFKNTDWDIVILDKMSYASNGLDRLRDINVYDHKRVKVFTTDFSQSIPDYQVIEIGNLDYIIHLGAETHVDRSIQDPIPFVLSNVLGTTHILNLARRQNNLKKMIYFSTDEVFGPAGKEIFHKEWDRYKSSNPYAASKAGGEEMAIAYHNTYKVPVIVTHTMNIFGERQHPEKFIPLCIKNTLMGTKMLIHSDKTKSVPGSRCWIHARNVAGAVLFLLDVGIPGDKYNIVGEELNNLEVAKIISSVVCDTDPKLKSLQTELVDYHGSRPGHDLRYALDGNKLLKLGFVYPKGLIETLDKTVRWTLQNHQWIF